jgi:hypothetical protein
MVELIVIWKIDFDLILGNLDREKHYIPSPPPPPPPSCHPLSLPFSLKYNPNLMDPTSSLFFSSFGLLDCVEEPGCQNWRHHDPFGSPKTQKYKNFKE